MVLEYFFNIFVRHFLHEACLQRWLKISVQCPMCMAKIEGEGQTQPAEKLDTEEQNQTAAGEQSTVYVQLDNENSMKTELAKQL